MDYAYYFHSSDQVLTSLGIITHDKYPGNQGTHVVRRHGHQYPVRRAGKPERNHLDFRYILLVTKTKIYWFRVGIYKRYVDLIRWQYRPYSDPTMKLALNKKKDRKMFLIMDFYTHTGGPVHFRYGDTNPVPPPLGRLQIN